MTMDTSNTSQKEKKESLKGTSSEERDNPINKEELSQAHNREGKDYKALEEKLILLQADFANYEKRVAKERTEWVMRAHETLLLALIPVINDFQRALQARPQSSPEETLKGVLLIQEKLFTTLKKQGVTPIQIAQGEEIIHEDHIEVVSTLPVEDPKKKGRVVEVVEQGYLYHGKILQRAKVIIGQ